MAVREHQTGSDFYRFLVWNLVLAWVPLVLALAAYASARRGASAASVAVRRAVAALLSERALPAHGLHPPQETPTTPLWYDALMLASFAWTGLLLGYASLYLMQMIWDGRSAIAVVARRRRALALASFGVYVGRFLRLNSWDVLVRPRRLAQVIHANLVNPLQHPRLIASLVVLTASLDDRLPRRLQLREPGPRAR